MLSVIETHLLEKGKWILICDMFNDEVITNQLSVNGQLFSKTDFEVERPKDCFSLSATRNIVIFTDMRCENLKSVSFV